MKNLNAFNAPLYLSLMLLPFLVVLGSCGGCKGTKSVFQSESKMDSSQTSNDKEDQNLNHSDIGETEFDLGILKNAPMLPLEEVPITEVYDHYILQDSINYQKYHFYDGDIQKTVDFSGTDVHLQVSRNQKYLTKMILIQNKMSNQYFLDVELRDASNTIIAKQSIPSAYQDYYDEFRDEIIPLENGSGFIQIGSRLGDSYWVAGYKIDGSTFIKKFQIDKPNSFLHWLKSNADGSKIVLKFNTKTDIYEKDTLVLYNIEKGVIWKKELNELGYRINHHWEESKAFYNENDMYLFKNGIDTGKVLRYNFDGKIIDSIDVSGNFHNWGFKDSEKGEFLLIYSKKILHLYNPRSKAIKKIDLYTMLQLEGDAYISIRNAMFSKSYRSEEEKIIFTFLIKKPNNADIHFSGIGFYNLKNNTIVVFQSEQFYGQVSSKNGELYLQKRLSYTFSERFDKINLINIK